MIAMVEQLQRVFERVGNLSEEEQKELAAIIETELADEARWDLRFAQTPDTLSKIAERAKRQYEQGLCGEL